MNSKTFKINLSLLIIMMSAISACQNHRELPRTQNPNLGKTESAVIMELGTPLSVEKSDLKAGATLLIYPEHTKIQIENNKVVAVFTNPEIEKEKNIQYWYQRLKDVPYEILNTVKNDTANGHVVDKTQQLVCEKLGLNILFDKDSGRVIRVVEYAAN